jgi:hypothetical protein
MGVFVSNKEWKRRAIFMVPVIFLTTLVFGGQTLPTVISVVLGFYALEAAVLWLLHAVGFFHSFPDQRSSKRGITD